MIFKRSQNKYGETPEPITPYQKAAQVTYCTAFLKALRK